jgi:aspartate/methionine/tyrosine aminotransferase
MPLKEDKGFAFDADEVLSLVTPRTRLLIVNSPANPTGGTVPREQFDRLVKGLERHPHVAIMSDEIYGQMLYDGREHVSLLSYPSIRDRLILLDGWSKTYAMTGWRLGYSIWPEKLVAQAERLAINCHSCVNASAQYAGLAALEGPQDAVHDMVAAFAKRRKVIVRALNQLPGVTCVEPGGAFYAFPNVSGTGLGSREFQDVMLNEAGVAALSGTAFGAHGEGYLRFSYANSVENIEEAMRRIGKLLTERTNKRQ